MNQALTINHQSRLLSININASTFLPSGGEGASIIPLFLDRENGIWVLYGKFKPGTRLPTHFHTGVVHFYTTKGQWSYLEYPDDVQTTGSYLYEPGGSIHTFTVAADAKEDAEGFMVVHGANVNFDGDKFLGIRDAGAIEDGILKYASANNLPTPCYITPGQGSNFTR